MSLASKEATRDGVHAWDDLVKQHKPIEDSPRADRLMIWATIICNERLHR